jgi:hypothetical protein
MTWWFLVDNGYGAFTQATVTALNWNEVPIKLKSDQADEDEGPY